MIYLITGLPGTCKTLFTISFVRDWSRKDDRPVFYSGIPLTDEGKKELGWSEIEPEKWNECPPRSIIVIDEAQRIYRNRSINSQAPKYVTDLETHRHLGVDLVFITQDPMLLDPAVRRLTNYHRHLVRIYGFDAATLHYWDGVKEQCGKPSYRKDSEKSRWVFDKTVYPLYRSAEVHTVKRRVPLRLLLIPAAAILVFVAVVVVRHLLVSRQSSPQSAKVAGPPSQSFGSVSVGHPLDPVADVRQYVSASTPRVRGLDFTAPRYDELTKPVRVPVPVACVQSADRCKCYSQQGTALDVPNDQCVALVRDGYFEAFDRGGRSDQALPVRDVPQPVEQSERPSPSLTVLGAEGYGVLGSKLSPGRPMGGKT